MNKIVTAEIISYFEMALINVFKTLPNKIRMKKYICFEEKVYELRSKVKVQKP
jgi:hypothetical protein